MYRTLTSFTLLTGILLLLSGLAAAQTKIPSRKEQVLEDRKEFILRLHDSISGVDKRLVNGRVYQPHKRNAKNHPFFGPETWEYGSVIMADAVFKNRPLMYDLQLDQPVMLTINPSGAYMLALNRQEVRGFTLGDARFVFLDPRRQDPATNLPRGYYQLLYHENGLAFYVRWTKYRKENMGFEPDEFIDEYTMIILKKGTFYPFRSNRSFARVFGHYRTAMRNYLRNQNIRVRQDPPVKLIPALKYYESLQAESP